MNKSANFTYLLFGLLIVLLMGPIAKDIFGDPANVAVSAVFAGTMSVSLWSLQESRVTFRSGVALAVIMVVATAVNYFVPSMVGFFIAITTLLLFCAMSLKYTLGQVLVGLQIDGNRLIGAVCAYLLLGLMWGLLFVLTELLFPGSFNNITVGATGSDVWDLFYYSFVTLTTLGYGDITPARPLAQTLAYMESLVGQLYIAILIGALVAIYLSGQTKSK